MANQEATINDNENQQANLLDNDGLNAGGNTVKPTRKGRKIDDRHMYWMVTIFNYLPNTIKDHIHESFNKISTYWFQEETCPTTKKDHIHICISFNKTPRTSKAIKDILGDNTIHLDYQAKYNYFKEKVVYVTNPYKRKPGGLYGSNDKDFKFEFILLQDEEDEPDNFSPYGWQLDALKIMKSKRESRRLYNFWEAEGEYGKSRFCEWLDDNYANVWCITPGKSGDIKFYISKMVNEFKKIPLAIVIDIAYGYSINDIDFSFIEELKNGRFFVGKYESTKCKFLKPHVLFFSNKEIPADLMTKNRINNIYIRKHEIDSDSE